MFGRALVLVGAAVLATGASPAGESAERIARGGACAGSSGSLEQLATIEDGSEGGFQCLGVLLDGDSVKALRLETHRFAPDGAGGSHERVVIAEFPPAVVESRKGAVLDGVPGHDAIILQGQLHPPPQPTILVTSYLYNGFTGEYRSCQITLDRQPNAGWRLIDRFSQTISRIVVKTRQMPVIGAFGIATLEGACP
jgi:hypothetical protein